MTRADSTFMQPSQPASALPGGTPRLDEVILRTLGAKPVDTSRDSVTLKELWAARDDGWSVSDFSQSVVRLEQGGYIAVERPKPGTVGTLNYCQGASMPTPMPTCPTIRSSGALSLMS